MQDEFRLIEPWAPLTCSISTQCKILHLGTEKWYIPYTHQQNRHTSARPTGPGRYLTNKGIVDGHLISQLARDRIKNIKFVGYPSAKLAREAILLELAQEALEIQ